MTDILVPALIALGGLLIADIRLPRLSIRAKTRELSLRVERMMKRRRGRETAREFVQRVNGDERESFAGRSYREARNVYEAIGQSGRYQKTLELSLLAGVAGAAAGLLLRSFLLSVVLAVGLYFLPLWLSRFSLYRYQRFVNDELETALSLITTSYLRSSDILSAAEENLSAIREPVRTVFTAFCNGLRYVDPNAAAQIERMKGQLKSPLFAEWCDALILCQDNHLLQAALPPIVSKFTALRGQQDANETRMMDPLRYAALMAGLVAGFPFILRVTNAVWYENLMHTLPGQLVLAGAAVAVFITVNRGIRLSEPISYGV